MTIEIKHVTKEEHRQYAVAIGRGFGEHLHEDRYAFIRRSDETGFPIGAVENGQFLGGSIVFPLEMTIPGKARLPTAVVSGVSVQPTHRRRGILNMMMDVHLKEAHERGEILSCLGASESVIYGRFGYGIATQSEDWTIERPHTAFAFSPEIKGRIRFVEKEEARKTFPDVVHRAYVERPGYVRLNDPHWDEFLEDPERYRGSATAFFHAVYEDEGRVDGYVNYRIQDDTLRINDLISVTRSAHAALWQFCFGVDLIHKTQTWRRAPDDPLLWMLANPRRLQRSVRDEMWLRLIDVGAALNARRYAVDDSLIIEVQDTFCPWNTGRYQLSGSPEGAECKPTTKKADIVLPAADLAAVYLGGVALRTLAYANRVEERTKGAVNRLDAMFWTAQKPWWPHEL